MQEKRKKEKEISELRDRLQTVELEKNKVEGKYKTLSKANGDAVADIEYFKSENKKLRSQLHEASTSKTSEQLQLRDSLAKVAAERDKYKEQYSALFRQLQQSMDSVQLLQTEKDRLQVFSFCWVEPSFIFDRVAGTDPRDSEIERGRKI